jgi:predicted transcriptional regulator
MACVYGLYGIQSNQELKESMKNRIKELIKNLGITAYKFSKTTGIPKNTVYLLKNNPDQYPSSSICDRIIDAYPQITPNDIVGRGANP